MEYIRCEYCNETKEWVKKRGRKKPVKYCSNACKFASKKKETFKTRCLECGEEYAVEPYRARKTKYCSRVCHNTAISRSSKPTHQSERHEKWKGENVTYKTLHRWLKRRFPKPNSCDFCGQVVPVDWANKSGAYKRDITDWLGLCRKCHLYFDFVLNKGLRRRYRNKKKNPAFAGSS